VAGSDYVADNDTLTFDPGQTNAIIAIVVNGDTLNEANETFTVNLLNPTAASIGDSAGTGVITNDDPFATLSITATAITNESCVATNGAIDPEETVAVSFTLKNISTGTAKTTNLVATLLAAGGVTAPSAAQTYGALTAGSSATRSFNFKATGVCGGPLTATLQLQDGPVSFGSVTNQFLLGKPITILTQNFDTVTAPSLPPGWTTSFTGTTGGAWATTISLNDTAPNSIFASDPDGTTDNRLTSPSIAISTTSAQLTFRHNYSAESFLDGGVLEISIGGGAFTDIIAAGGSFITNGYNETISGGTKPAWSGYSGGFITTKAILPSSAAGQMIQLRWRFLSDIFVGDLGWYVDTISITDGATCCTPPPPPTLTGVRVETNAVISWLVDPYSYTLQSNTNLSTTNWANVTNVTLSGNRYYSTNAILGNNIFFRLKR
jgi:hypothetical protein